MRTKKTFINILTDVIPLIIISVLGIFKLKLFIQILGDETLGLYQLFTQIMVYVSIVDGGIGSAVLYSLYKPNTNKENGKLSSLLSGASKSFSLIGALVFFLAFIASFFAPFLIKDSSFPFLYVSLTFMLFSISNIIGYLFVPYNVLLEVKEKKYVANLALQIGQIIQSVLEIVMLLSGVSFILILCMHSIIKLVSNLVIMFLAKKLYPEIDYHKKEKDFSFMSQLKHLIFHKVNGLIGSNIDILIISKALGLTAVAVYSTYNYVINMLKQILEKISVSMTAIMGNKLISDKNESYPLFLEMNSMMFYLATIICVPLLFAIDQFINIWYEGSIATNFMIALGFISILFLFIVKMSITIFITARGLFKETKICALADTIINFVLSIILCMIIGIPGVLFATAFSVFIAEYCMKTRVIYKIIFEKSFSDFHIKNIKFFLIFLLDLGLSYLIIQNIHISNIFIWFGFYLIFSVLNAIIVLVIYHLLKETKFLNRFKVLLKG